MEPGDFHFGHQGAGQEGTAAPRRLGRADGLPSWHDHFLKIWEIIKEAERTTGDDSLTALHKKMKAQHQSYINAVNRWLSTKELDDQERSAEEAKTRVKAAALKPRYEKLLYRYCLCYMYLNRHLIHLRKDIETLLRHVPSRKGAGHTGLKIQDNVGFLLRRAYREKQRFVAERAQLENMHTLLKELAPLFAGLKTALSALKGKEQGDRAYTAFRAYLRQGQVEKAHSLAASWAQGQPGLAPFTTASKTQTVQQYSQSILAAYTAHGDALRHGAQMALDVDDIRVMSSFVRISEERIDTFLQKYSLPFIEFKYKILLKQAYRLGTIGNFEKLFALHENIILGLADTGKDARALQAYEGTVLRPAEYILHLGASSLTDIFEQMDAAVAELKALLHSIRSLFRK